MVQEAPASNLIAWTTNFRANSGGCVQGRPRCPVNYCGTFNTCWSRFGTFSAINGICIATTRKITKLVTIIG